MSSELKRVIAFKLQTIKFSQTFFPPLSIKSLPFVSVSLFLIVRLVNDTCLLYWQWRLQSMHRWLWFLIIWLRRWERKKQWVEMWMAVVWCVLEGWRLWKWKLQLQALSKKLTWLYILKLNLTIGLYIYFVLNMHVKFHSNRILFTIRIHKLILYT